MNNLLGYCKLAESVRDFFGDLAKGGGSQFGGKRKCPIFARRKMENVDFFEAEIGNQCIKRKRNFGIITRHQSETNTYSGGGFDLLLWRKRKYSIFKGSFKNNILTIHIANSFIRFFNEFTLNPSSNTNGPNRKAPIKVSYFKNFLNHGECIVSKLSHSKRLIRVSYFKKLFNHGEWIVFKLSRSQAYLSTIFQKYP